MRIKSGGGITSNKLKESKSYKQEPIAHKASPAGAAQQGMAVQFRKEPLQQGRGYEPGPTKETGIAQATYNSNRVGPGSQRTTYRAGSQAPTPPAREMPAGRNTLGEYGPERRR